MKILILGATGRVGSRLLRYAHEAQHELSVYVRQPHKLPNDIPFSCHSGDILDAEKLEEAFQGQDAILSALGAGAFSQDSEFLSTAILAVAETMEKTQLKRLLWMSGEAILESEMGLLRKDLQGFPPVLKDVAQDHWAVYEYLLETRLDWTLICPPPMPERVRTGHYRALANQLPEGGQLISVEDVADFILKEVHENAFLRQRVGLAY